ncbi:MAG: low specificity L-threonine aldolase [Acidobacteria bacterium]|nr:low specificity L-threonine aldolase [Acidobacteriota bacterium]
MRPSRSFASDNNAGVHPGVLKFIAAVNQGHAVGYGDDAYTDRAVRQFKRHFGKDIEVFFVFNGTGANALGLRALTNSYHAIICAQAAHIYVDECGAPEKFTGCKLLPVRTENGKLTVEAVRAAYHGIGDQHHVQPRVISITQASEVGTVYRPEEIRSLAQFAHQHGMFLHADGARIANAAASLKQNLRAATSDLGIDVLSFGATKNGGLGADAVVFFDARLAADFRFYRKQGMQLASKMRFLSAQFAALFEGDLWLRNAQHANRMARLLEGKLRRNPNIKIVYPVEANGVFAQIPASAIAKLQKRYFFYLWDDEQSVVRWMCSWDTSEQDVEQFVNFVNQIVRA